MMESLPTVVAETREPGPIQSGTAPDAGPQATEINSFIGLIAPLLANAATIDQNVVAAARAQLAEGTVPGTANDGTRPLWPMVAVDLPRQRPMLATLSRPLLRGAPEAFMTRAVRSSSRVEALDRMPPLETSGPGSAQAEHALLRRAQLTGLAHERDMGSAFIRDGRTEADAQGEPPRGGRLNITPSDLGSLTQVVKLTDGATAAQNIVAKQASLPVAQPAVFAQRLEQHISVMLTQQVQHARISVSPPELGPVEAHVTVIGDEATVQLISPHAATRDALEDALPRLRSLFTDSGLALGYAGVFTETPRHRPDQALHGSDDGHSDAVAHEASTEPAGRIRVHIGLIDAYI